jgi:hypothetical protein
MRTWVRDPHAGGVKIPKRVQERTRQRIVAYEQHEAKDVADARHDL